MNSGQCSDFSESHLTCTSPTPPTNLDNSLHHDTLGIHTHVMHTERVIPKVRKLDDEICDVLEELAAAYKNPKKVPHPFNRKRWRHHLRNHPEGEAKFMLITQGFKLGLKPGIDPKRLSRRVCNYINSRRECLAILKCLLKELQKGYIVPGAGWYQLNLLCVPKKNNDTGLMTEIRVARHGSYCRGKAIAINDAVTQKARRMKLPGFRDYVWRLYQHTHVSLRDLKDAFRQLLLCLSDRQYVQYCLFGLRFRDLRVAYGEAAAAACCQEFSELIIWMCENDVPAFKDKLERLSVHVDDFMIAGDANDIHKLTNAFDLLLKDLGVKDSEKKRETAIQRGIVHGFGFKLDTPVKTVLIPKLKVIDLLKGTCLILIHHYATDEALESLSGKIMHWTMMDKRAKSLCNRGMRRLHFYIRKQPKHRKKYTIRYVDLVWRKQFALFLRFFIHIREVSMESILFTPFTTLTASTDACDTGGGFMLANQWYSYSFSEEVNCMGRKHSTMHINLKEAHAILQLLHHCRHQLTGRRLWLLCDSKVCVHSIFKAWSGSFDLMDFVQEISMVAMTYCIDMFIQFIPTYLNTLSDLLSRGKIDAFHQEAKQWGIQPVQMTDVDYYDHLRIMHGPIRMPDWIWKEDGIPMSTRQELHRLFALRHDE